jgi:hypothetical protein
MDAGSVLGDFEVSSPTKTSIFEVNSDEEMAKIPDPTALGMKIMDRELSKSDFPVLKTPGIPAAGSGQSGKRFLQVSQEKLKEYYEAQHSSSTTKKIRLGA